jgi:hypothetical protein
MAAATGPIVYRPYPLDGTLPLVGDLKVVTIKKGAVVETAGWSIKGIGAAQYVNDDLAKQLYLEHPRFCSITATGRYVRLLPADGMILIEQGGAYGTKADKYQFNDQPAIQAAINYARAIGVESVGFSQSNYNIHVTTRTSDPALGAIDGQGLYVAADQRLRLVGLGSSQTRLVFLTDQGESFDGNAPRVNYQIVNGTPWRGCGIFVDTHSIPTNPKRSAIQIENMWIDGGSRRDLRTADPSMLDWDVTNKGICVMPDRLGGDVTILNCVMSGWRGETVYCSNDVKTTLIVRNSIFTDSNGQGLNPNGCHVDIDLCKIRNCFAGIEGWTGDAGGRIVRTTIEGCFGPGGTGGSFALQGGTAGTSARSIYYLPTQVTPGVDPIGEIDITCRQSGRAMAGWWLKGSLTLVDTVLVLGEPMAFNEGAQHLDLRVTLAYELNMTSIVMIAGGAGVQGDKLTDNCNLEVAMLPPSGDFTAPYHLPVAWYGSLGGNINVRLLDCEMNKNPAPMGPVLDQSPNFS